jgi:hypothetical protein
VSEPEDDPGIAAALDLLAAGPAELERRLAAGDGPEAALRRQQLETLAALAWSLPPEAAPAALRNRLLAGLQGDETHLVSPMARLGAPPQVEALRRETAAVRAPARPPARVPVAPRAAPARGWALPLAAVLALCTLGALAWSGWLWRDLDRTRAELARLRRHDSELVAQLEQVRLAQPQMAAMREKLREMNGQLALVTASSSLVCPLRPSPGAPAPGATGVLFVADDHQHWYLRMQKLAPLPAGHVYQLWFLVGDQPVRAGIFDMRGEEGVLASPTMPSGTSAAMVTMEPAGATGERPSGPVVLFGRQITPLV